MATKGICSYCGKELSKRGTTRHLEACEKRVENIKKNSCARGKKLSQFYILSISAEYDPSNFWMYIAIRDDAKLSDLDDFLRNVWVECCGHLSCFRIRKQTYDNVIENDPFWMGSSLTMDVMLKNVISEKMTFNYEYDFGTTTHIQLKVVKQFSAMSENQIEIMARNIRPVYTCVQCSNRANYFHYEEGQFYCENCIDEDEMDYVDIGEANSPRSGVCGYVENNSAAEAYMPLVR